jgi:hypothetical protein
MKTDNFNTVTTGHDEWLTPPGIIRALGEFDLDPCSPVVRPWPTAKHHFNVHDDGLNKPWTGRVWMNPPYGTKTFEWMKKLANHGNGIALIFARTETKGFHREIFNRATAIFFFEGRLKFHLVNGAVGPSAANAPSCLIAYGKENAMAIANSGLLGRFLWVNQ